MRYEFNEFCLELPDDWVRESEGEDATTVLFRSRQRSAHITISAELYLIPWSKLADTAKSVRALREENYAKLCDGEVIYLQRSLKPHSSGSGFEILSAAMAEGERAFLYLGYVTTRKILNFFVETSNSDTQYAAGLFGSLVGSYEPRLP